MHIVDRYFDGGLCSVYFWDLDEGFAGVVLIKKDLDGDSGVKGSWDAIHIVEVLPDSAAASAAAGKGTPGKPHAYKLTSNVMLRLQSSDKALGSMDLGGSLTRQVGSSSSPCGTF